MSTFQDRRNARARVAIDILPPEAGKGNVIHFRRTAEVVDAHFVPVRHSDGARSRNPDPSESANSRPANALAAGAGKIIAASAQMIETRLLRLSPDSFLALVAAIFIGVFTLCGGFSLISDNSAVAESGPALDITHVTLTPQDANGMRVLLINGIVENRTDDRLAMPSIRAELMSGETVVASTLINTETSQIGGGESYGFSARVPHPGGKLPDLRLSLAERGA